MHSISWSVSIEEQFYCFWPAVFILPRKFWQLIIGIMFLVGLLFRIYYADSYHHLYYHSLSILPELAVGGYLAILIQLKPKIKLFFTHLQPYHRNLIILVNLLWFFQYFYWIDASYGAAIGHLGSILCLSVLILSQALAPPPKHLLYNTLAYWGKYTYAIYLLHPITIAISDVCLRKLGFSTGSLGGGLLMSGLALILVLGLSWLSYTYFESYFLKWKERFR